MSVSRTRYSRPWVLSLMVLAQGCSGSETTVRVAVEYEDAWALSELEVRANGRTTRVAAAHEVLVWMDDAWAQQEIAIEVAGFRDGQRYAFGRVDVTPVLGTEVRATVALQRKDQPGPTQRLSRGYEAEGHPDGCRHAMERLAAILLPGAVSGGDGS